jgi:hypothetical protein
VHCIPAFRSSLTIYEDGLETVVQGKTTAFRYDQLTSLSVKYTHHKLNHQYIGTKANLEFFVDGRLLPHKIECEFRSGNRTEQLLALATEKCSQAIQIRLLGELERTGAVRWRDNVSLTAEGILLKDSASASRLIPFREIVDWKIADNDLKIWKANDALPCLMMTGETPNFVPLFNLFESLASALRTNDPSRDLEPSLAAQA